MQFTQYSAFCSLNECFHLMNHCGKPINVVFTGISQYLIDTIVCKTLNISNLPPVYVNLKGKQKQIETNLIRPHNISHFPG